MERIHVRRMLRQVTDERGWPTLANIVHAGDDGRPERVFMQEELFGPEEYRQVVAYHYGMARHHLSRRRPTASTPRRAMACSYRSSTRTTARFERRGRWPMIAAVSDLYRYPPEAQHPLSTRSVIHRTS